MLSSGTWYSVMARAVDFRGDIGEGRVQRDVCRSSVHMSGKGVRVSFSWGGSAFHTYLSVIE